MDIKKEQFYRQYVQREDNFVRAPLNPEINFYTAIADGDIKKVRELCKDPLVDKPGLGRLSDDPLQNLKYHFVITTALTARFCVNAGMSLSDAYGLSDFYIQKADKCRRQADISALHPQMSLDYATKMKKLKKHAICSKQIVMCIDYIYDNLHAKIGLEKLAEHVKLSPAYLSRLFKKETGSSVSDYIRRQKLETAKNMLLYSDFKPARIASVLAFPSQSYFNEIFKKYTGMTPGQFRKTPSNKISGYS